MRLRAILIATLLLVVSVAGYASCSTSLNGPRPSPSPSPPASPSPLPSPSPTPTASPIFSKNPVAIDTPGFVSWALLNRVTGEIYSSPNASTPENSSHSVIKAWIAADFLRATPAPTQSDLNSLTSMIRDSDNSAASSFWSRLGGKASWDRLVSLCSLTDSYFKWDWANSHFSANDLARMADCVADGVAGPQHTPWLLNEMRNIRGQGAFGIPFGLPEPIRSTVSYKNGWFPVSDGKWHVNCLAIIGDWTIGVSNIYPSYLGLSHGANNCAEVAHQLLTPNSVSEPPPQGSVPT